MDDYYYRSAAGVFPVRWTAPESMLTLVFSAANDVWAFGITLIEVYLPAGVAPYGEILNGEVQSAVIGGERCARPARRPTTSTTVCAHGARRTGHGRAR